MRYKMLQKQRNPRTSWKIPPNFLFSKGGDKLLKKLLWTCRKTVREKQRKKLYSNVTLYRPLTINILDISIKLVNKVFVAFVSNTWYHIISCPDFKSEVNFFLSALLFLQSRYLKISKFCHHHIDVVVYHEKCVIKSVIKLFNLL